MANNLASAKNMYAAIEDALFLGDRLDRSEFAFLMQPGQFISPNIQENDSSDYMQIQAALVDDTVGASFIYQPLGSRISSVYQDILEFKALPYRALTGEEKRELDNIRTWLNENTQLYQIWSDRYYDALDAYETEQRSQNPSSSRLRRLEQKRRDAENQWNSIGRRQEWERKQARSNYILSGDPSVRFNDLASEVNFHRKQAPNRGEYLQTFLIPSVSEWNSPTTSWGTYEKTISESDSSSYSRSTNWSGGASGGWGLFSAKVSAGGSSHYEHSTCEASTFSLKFDYLRVRIDRPWLDPTVFGYKFWTWKKVAGFRRISTGVNTGVIPPVAPIGEMPVLPTHLIVARNVELVANWSSSDREFIQNSISGSAGGGWGPFSVSGSYSETTTEEKVKSSFDGMTVRIQNPQVIGMSGILLAKTPDPNRNLPWQGDEVFEEEGKDWIAYEEAIRDMEYRFATALDEIEAERQRGQDELNKAAGAEVQKALPSFPKAPPAKRGR